MPEVRRQWLQDLRDNIETHIASATQVFSIPDLIGVMSDLLQDSQPSDIFDGLSHTAIPWMTTSSLPRMSPFEETPSIVYLVSKLVLIRERDGGKISAGQLVEKGGSGLPIGSRPTNWRVLGYPGSPVRYIELDAVLNWSALPQWPRSEGLGNWRQYWRSFSRLEQPPVDWTPPSMVYATAPAPENVRRVRYYTPPVVSSERRGEVFGGDGEQSVQTANEIEPVPDWNTIAAAMNSLSSNEAIGISVANARADREITRSAVSAAMAESSLQTANPDVVESGSVSAADIRGWADAFNSMTLADTIT